MGALNARSYEVTPPSHSHALTPPTRPTNRSKDTKSRQAYGESDPVDDANYILTGLRAARLIISAAVRLWISLHGAATYSGVDRSRGGHGDTR
jgi:hypothetical protein